MKIKRPRVGLLSIGEEEHKGNALTRDATPLLNRWALISSGPTVRGRDIFSVALAETNTAVRATNLLEFRQALATMARA